MELEKLKPIKEEDSSLRLLACTLQNFHTVLHSAATGAELDTETVIKPIFTKLTPGLQYRYMDRFNQQPCSSCGALSFNILPDLNILLSWVTELVRLY